MACFQSFAHAPTQAACVAIDILSLGQNIKQLRGVMRSMLATSEGMAHQVV
jgi:hypothetical protein